jgi:hypothetical protein
VDSRLLSNAKELLDKELILKARDILESEELSYSICVSGNAVLSDAKKLLDKESISKTRDLLESKELLYNICVLGDAVLSDAKAILFNKLIVLVPRNELSVPPFSKVNRFVLLCISAVIPLK